MGQMFTGLSLVAKAVMSGAVFLFHQSWAAHPFPSRMLR